MKHERTSPIPKRDRGLPSAGASAHAKVEEGLAYGVYLFGGGLGFVLAGSVYWITVALSIDARLPMSAVMLVGVFMCAAMPFRAVRRTRPYALGAEGERAVGRALDALAADGSFVFHDVKPRAEEDWNIDDVVVGPGGVFAVETKNWRYRGDEKPTIEVEGEGLARVWKDGRREPISHAGEALEQAARNAKTLRDVLRESTDRSFAVQPVLALPGYFVEKGEISGVRVRNHNYLHGELKKLRGRLAKEDVALVRSRLALMR